MIVRNIKNPLISPRDVKPVGDDFEVVGVFNPGVTTYKGKTALLIRVAQRVKDKGDNMLRVPVFNKKTKSLDIICFDKNDRSIDFSDSRLVKLGDGTLYLTSCSFLRLATSRDGSNFVLRDDINIIPDNIYEAYGIEDARITKIGRTYYINYSSASELGIITGLIRTKDFIRFERMGVIFPPDNKDVSIFPEKIDGRYYALHRPSTSAFGKPEIWIADSPDLVRWGNHKHLLGVRKGLWDGARVGASSVPMRTDAGWLVIYHGADENNKYSLGAMLLDINNPSKLIARTPLPFAAPEADYEVNGFFDGVVFACGCVEKKDGLEIYYGAGDKYICGITVSKKNLFSGLAPTAENE